MKSYSWDIVLKKRKELFGLSIIGIILFHIYCSFGLSSSMLESTLGIFLIRGNIGVDIFLFLSATGLYNSLSVNNIYIYIYNRVKRVLVPYLLSVGLFYLLYEIILSHQGWKVAILNISTLSFWTTGVHITWYIALILPLYILFPLLFAAQKRYKYSSWIIVGIVVIGEFILKYYQSAFLNHCEIALSRIPIFLIGLGCADYVFKKNIINRTKLYISGVTLLLSFVLISVITIDNILLHYIYGVFAFTIVVLYPNMSISIRNGVMHKFLSYLGSISLELYITHVLLIRMLIVLDVSLPIVVYYLIIPVLSVILALCLQWFSKLVSSLLPAPKAQ